MTQPVSGAGHSTETAQSHCASGWAWRGLQRRLWSLVWIQVGHAAPVCACGAALRLLVLARPGWHGGAGSTHPSDTSPTPQGHKPPRQRAHTRTTLVRQRHTLAQ